MAYDQDFYKLYQKYLDEETVRKAHDQMFNLFGTIVGQFPDIIDLGAGLCELHEYFYKYTIGNYCAIEKNEINFPTKVQSDYTTFDFVDKLPFTPKGFASLFSMECCLSAEAKYHFYHRLFQELPSIRYGFVSGFYHKSKMQFETCEEVSGIVSYQTIEDQKLHQSSAFRELRVLIDVPSKLFGNDVVEVWKILERI